MMIYSDKILCSKAITTHQQHEPQTNLLLDDQKLTKHLILEENSA